MTRLPLLLRLAQSNPMFRSFVRETSKTLTCSMPCCTPLTFMLLITSGKYLLATETIFGTASC